MYATASDIAALLGRELTEAETTQVDAIIAMASLAADAHVTNIDAENVPAAVKAVVLAATLRRFTNPAGVSSETVGGYSASYANGGALLTDAEIATLRRARTQLGTIRTPSAAIEG